MVVPGVAGRVGVAETGGAALAFTVRAAAAASTVTPSRGDILLDLISPGKGNEWSGGSGSSGTEVEFYF